MLPARHTQQGVQHRSTPGGRDTCVRSALARSMRGPARGAHPGRRGLPADAHVKARPRHGQVGQARLHRALQPPRRRPARPPGVSRAGACRGCLGGHELPTQLQLQTRFQFPARVVAT